MPHIHKLYDFVVSVFIVHRAHVLLVYHKKYGEWLPIGGHIELDEDPEEALHREIKEESGLLVRILSHAPRISHPGVKPLPAPDFMDVHTTLSVKDKARQKKGTLTKAAREHKHIAFVYFAVASGRDVVLHEREHREYRWVSEQELDDPALKLVPSIRFYCVQAIHRAEKACVKKEARR